MSDGENKDSVSSPWKIETQSRPPSSRFLERSKLVLYRKTETDPIEHPF